MPDIGGVLVSIFVLALLSDFAAYAAEIPLLRLVEQAICTRLSMFADDDDEADICKSARVQNKLAFFVGMKSALDALPSLIVSLWYGDLANQHGRRSILSLACTGEILNVIWVVYICSADDPAHFAYAYFGAAFFFIGGGRFLFCAMLYTISVDVLPPSTRSLYLCLIHGLRQFVGLWATNVGAQLSKTDLVFPFVIIIAVQTVRYGVIFIMPETSPLLSERHVAEPPTAEAERSETSHETRHRLPRVSSSQPEDRQSPQFWEAYRVLAKRPGMTFCFFAYTFKRVAFSSERLVFQYLSETLKTGLADTSWAQIPLGISATIVTVVLIPGFTELMRTHEHPSADILMTLIRGSLLVAVVGFTGFWLSHNKPWFAAALFACGAAEGLEPCLQAFASALVKKNLHSHLFAALSVLDTMAKLAGGPANAMLYAIRDSEGQPLGLCFIAAAALFSTLLVFSCIGSVGRPTARSMSEESSFGTDTPPQSRRLLEDCQDE